jgi:hypothetical protein
MPPPSPPSEFILHNSEFAPRPSSLARLTLTSFLLTFLAARTLVYLIMSRRLPDLYLHLGGTHVHHLNYGIVLLSLTGATLLFARPAGKLLSATAAAYGTGLALTFDEFGMWLHLGGPYWQRASFDAVTLIAALLALLAFAPHLSRFRPRHWTLTALLLLSLAAFTWLLLDTASRAAHHLAPSFQSLEQSSPP